MGGGRKGGCVCVDKHLHGPGPLGVERLVCGLGAIAHRRPVPRHAHDGVRVGRVRPVAHAQVARLVDCDREPSGRHRVRSAKQKKRERKKKAQPQRKRKGKKEIHSLWSRCLSEAKQKSTAHITHNTQEGKEGTRRHLRAGKERVPLPRVAARCGVTGAGSGWRGPLRGARSGWRPPSGTRRRAAAGAGGRGGAGTRPPTSRGTPPTPSG